MGGSQTDNDSNYLCGKTSTALEQSAFSSIFFGFHTKTDSNDH